MERRSQPVVPLEAGVGKENPPCPACGEPLFGWALVRPDASPVRRCELCLMAVVGDRAEPDEARTALRAIVDSGRPPANRRSFQAWIGSSGWAALEPGSRFLFTPDAARRLGFIPGRSRFDLPGMWQTLVNAFTFGHNQALARFGDRSGTEANSPWKQGLDWAITAFTAIPLFVVAMVFETAAAVFRHGGTFTVAVSADAARR